MSDAVVLVTGSDATIVNDTVHEVIDELLDGHDPSMALEDFLLKEKDAEEDELAPVISRVLDALHTPPFLIDRRVVVLRGAQGLSSDDAKSLAAWADAPIEGTTLVLATVSDKAKPALSAMATRVISTSVGSQPKLRAAFVAERFEAHELKCPPGVLQRVAERVGDDVARVDSVARTLSSVFGTSALTFDQIEPYLGDAGDVPEWDLTEAIDAGNAAKAITVARRMLDSRDRVGVMIVNILRRHYWSVARLEGSGAQSETEAAALLGIHQFRAKKVLTASRVLGPDRIAHAISLIARADQDLKGGAHYGAKNERDVELTDLTVIEVLVARLAKMAEAARRR